MRITFQAGLALCCAGVLMAPLRMALSQEPAVSVTVSPSDRQRLEAMDKALALNPSDFQLWKSLGDLHSALGNHTAALASYRKLLALRPDGPSWHALVARELATIGGHRDEALVEYEEAVGLEENVGWRAGTVKSYNSYRQSIGLAEMTLPEIVASRNARFRRAVGTPAEQQARVEVLIADAERLAAKRNFSDATALLRDAIALAPDRADLYEKMADWNNHSDERIALLRDAVGVEPTPARWARLGKEQLANFDYDGAIDSYRKASEMDPASAQGHADLAYGYMRARRSKEAMGEYEHALDLDPSSDANWYSYNRLRAEAGLPKALSPNEQQAAAARAAAAPVAAVAAAAPVAAVAAAAPVAAVAAAPPALSATEDAQVRELVASALGDLGIKLAPEKTAPAQPTRRAAPTPCEQDLSAMDRQLGPLGSDAKSAHERARSSLTFGDLTAACRHLKTEAPLRQSFLSNLQQMRTIADRCLPLGSARDSYLATVERATANAERVLSSVRTDAAQICDAADRSERGER